MTDHNAAERARWGGPSPFAGKDSRTEVQKRIPGTPELSQNDMLTTIDALSGRARELRKMARGIKYVTPSKRAPGLNTPAALRTEAANCERVGKLFAATWGLPWREES